MAESTTISVPRRTPLSERISLVSGEISAWLKTLDSPFSIDKDTLRLTKCERDGKEYRYSYAIYRGVASNRTEKSSSTSQSEDSDEEN